MGDLALSPAERPEIDGLDKFFGTREGWQTTWSQIAAVARFTDTRDEHKHPFSWVKIPSEVLRRPNVESYFSRRALATQARPGAQAPGFCPTWCAFFAASRRAALAVDGALGFFTCFLGAPRFFSLAMSSVLRRGWFSM
jgi:hypothetical protein